MMGVLTPSTGKTGHLPYQQVWNGTDSGLLEAVAVSTKRPDLATTSSTRRLHHARPRGLRR